MSPHDKPLFKRVFEAAAIEPASDQALGAALIFAEVFKESVHVCHLTGGGLQFDWVKGELAIDSDGDIHLTYIPGPQLLGGVRREG